MDYSLFETRIEADQMISEDQRLFEFSGKVSLDREKQHIAADLLKLDNELGLMDARGNATFSDPLLYLTADSAHVNDQNNSALFREVTFQLFDSHLNGTASALGQKDENIREFTDITYTTCDPGKNTWSLSADKLTLDELSGRGTARHTVLRIKDVPVFYFPWFQFPIDDRRMSGVLAPLISSSSAHGTEFSLPVYWNLAENYDMTLIPVNYTERGMQLNTENRYLFKQNLGQLELSYLDDEKYQPDLNDQKGTTQRWFRRWRHEADFFGVHASLLSQKVSDPDYLEDFEHLAAIQNEDYLKSSALFSSSVFNWSTTLLFEQYDPNNQEFPASLPYRRLPQITVNRIFSAQESSAFIDWKNEYVTFDKDNSINADRLHISPKIGIPLEGSYYYVKPELTLNFTRYNLEDDFITNTRQQRSLSIFSVDSGLFFERLVSNNGKSWLQTLEPRMYALYVPYKDQSDIPNFDSSLAAESYTNLFTNNRFVGADRIGDSKQLSLGLSTRFLDNKTGYELFSASIGQAFYAEDRQVSLSNTVDTREKSSVMTLLKFHPAPEWDFQISNVFDQINRESEQTDISLRRLDADSTLNLEYHFLENSLEQTTVSFVYPMTPNWNTFAKRQHSLVHDRQVQNLFGFSYESCCWAFKMLYEENTDDAFENTNYSVYFQLTFKGLSNAGKDIDSILEDGILGYRPVY